MNFFGTYSDEIFKEQNKLIEDQVISVRMTQDDAILAKYNLQAIVEFMKDKFANLGNTYQFSNLSQIRVLLCSIFPSGMSWSYPGFLNTKISPIYQSIRAYETKEVSLGAEDDSYFELFLPLLTHFTRLMEAYQAMASKDKDDATT